MNTIPTNHGNMAINEIFDYLNYVSYKTQRESNCPATLLKQWYKDADRLEERFIKEQNPERSVATES